MCSVDPSQNDFVSKRLFLKQSRFVKDLPSTVPTSSHCAGTTRIFFLGDSPAPLRPTPPASPPSTRRPRPAATPTSPAGRGCLVDARHPRPAAAPPQLPSYVSSVNKTSASRCSPALDFTGLAPNLVSNCGFITMHFLFCVS